VDVESAKDLTKGKEIDDEQDRAEYRALGNSRGEGRWLGCEGFQLDELSAAREIRFKPVQGCVGNANRC